MDHTYESEMDLDNLMESLGEVERTDYEIYPGKVITGDVPVNNFYRRLIDLVKDEPNIYDRMHPSFRSAEMKELSWSRIARELKTTSGFAQNRWTRMRERFSKEKKAIDEIIKEGGRLEQRRVWPYLIPMFFLATHVKRRNFINRSESYRYMTDNVKIQTGVKTHPENEAEDMDKFLLIEEKFSPGVDDHPQSSGYQEGDDEAGNDQEEELEKKVKLELPPRFTPRPRKIAWRPKEMKQIKTEPPSESNTDNKILKLPRGAFLLQSSSSSNPKSPLVLLTPTDNKTPLVAAAASKSSPILPSSVPQLSAALKPNTESPEHHFGKLIAVELERLPEHIRSKKKQKLLMVLYE